MECVMKLSRIAFVLLFVLCCGNSGRNSDSSRPALADFGREGFPLSEEEVQRLDSLLISQLDQMRFNGNVVVVYKNVPLFFYSRGYRHLSRKEPLDRNTVFQLASVSKAFTAMAIMLLHQRHKLNIEDRVVNYLTEFPWPDVKIIHLLQHTSGLPNYMYFIDNQWPKDKPLTYNDVLKSLKSPEAQLLFKPGSRFDYSNTGYALLAMIVEKVSGQPFHVFLRQNIFEPLQMNNTFAWNKETFDTITNIATGFKRSGKGYYSVAPDPLDEISGDKSIYSTIEDLLKWEKAWTSNILVEDSLLERAFNQTVLSRDKSHEYGFGWRIIRSDTTYRIFHNGMWNGFTSAFHRFVNDSITIILLSNTNAHSWNVVNNLYHQIRSFLNNNSISTAPLKKTMSTSRQQKISLSYFPMP